MQRAGRRAGGPDPEANDRRPDRRARTPWAPLLAALGLTAFGCTRPASDAPPVARDGAATPAASESARTQELERTAADNQRKFEEIQSSDLSAEEKARAASELVDEQQKAIRDSESGDGDPE